MIKEKEGYTLHLSQRQSCVDINTCIYAAFNFNFDCLCLLALVVVVNVLYTLYWSWSNNFSVIPRPSHSLTSPLHFPLRKQTEEDSRKGIFKQSDLKYTHSTHFLSPKNIKINSKFQ